MFYTLILNFFKTKAGKMALLVIVALMVVGGFKWKISRLQGKIDRLQVEKADVAIRNKICQADLGALVVSVNHQNEKVAELEKVNKDLATASAAAAGEAISTPAEIERVVTAGTGPVAMNDFFRGLFNEE